MRFNTHLIFNGQCEEAFKLYEECLGGEITLMLKYGNSPMAQSTPPDLRDKIVHANLNVGDQRLTGVDVPSTNYEKPRGFSVQLNIEGSADAQRIFDILAEGGNVVMPLQKTFWAAHYAVLTDRFGTPWEINCGAVT
jgi:PhnB protein